MIIGVIYNLTIIELIIFPLYKIVHIDRCLAIITPFSAK